MAKVCSKAGCHRVCAGSRCAEHAVVRDHKWENASRSYNSNAVYGNERWRKMRLSWLKLHPLCEACLKIDLTTAATDVDHIIAHRGDVRLMWDDNNLRSLCHSCHSKKTGLERGKYV